jgi:hypothetical protein
MIAVTLKLFVVSDDPDLFIANGDGSGVPRSEEN